MASKKYKVIWKKEIFVNGKKRLPDEVFAEEDSNEMKTLVRTKYCSLAPNDQLTKTPEVQEVD